MQFYFNLHLAKPKAGTEDQYESLGENVLPVVNLGEHYREGTIGKLKSIVDCMCFL